MDKNSSSLCQQPLKPLKPTRPTPPEQPVMLKMTQLKHSRESKTKVIWKVVSVYLSEVCQIRRSRCDYHWPASSCIYFSYIYILCIFIYLFNYIYTSCVLYGLFVGQYGEIFGEQLAYYPPKGTPNFGFFISHDSNFHVLTQIPGENKSSQLYNSKHTSV